MPPPERERCASWFPQKAQSFVTHVSRVSVDADLGARELRHRQLPPMVLSCCFLSHGPLPHRPGRESGGLLLPRAEPSACWQPHFNLVFSLVPPTDSTFIGSPELVPSCQCPSAVMYWQTHVKCRSCWQRSSPQRKRQVRLDGELGGSHDHLGIAASSYPLRVVSA